MSGILVQLGIAPVQYACTEQADAVDLSALMPLTPFGRNSIEGFCAQINRATTHAVAIINGEHGEVERRTSWHFWTPILSLQEEPAELTFSIGRSDDSTAIYTLCFHGNLAASTLERCVLFSQVNDPLLHMRHAYHSAHAIWRDDDEGMVRRFTLRIKGSTDHTLEFRPNPDAG